MFKIPNPEFKNPERRRKAEEVSDFLAEKKLAQDKGSVCPYSLPEYDFAFINTNNVFLSDIEAFKRKLFNLRESDASGLIVVMEDDIPDHEIALDRSECVLDLTFGFSELRMGSEEEVPKIVNMTTFTLDNKGYFCFAMNNLYEPGHPRYLPHNAVVFTDAEKLFQKWTRAVSNKVAKDCAMRIAKIMDPDIDTDELQELYNFELTIAHFSHVFKSEAMSNGTDLEEIAKRIRHFLLFGYNKFYALPYGDDFGGIPPDVVDYYWRQS